MAPSMASQLLEFAATLGFITFSFLSIVFVTIILFVVASIISFSIFYIKESIRKADRPPIVGTVFHQLIYFNTVFDFQTSIARRHQTFRLIRPSHSEIFTADPANIKHILKSNFSKYSKGWDNYRIMKDLFGDGIFAVDGKEWRHQRKVASYEFSTKVLRDYGSVVFQQNAAKLARKISDAVNTATMIDMKDFLMRLTLDSFFKRYADIFWEIKRLLNIGLEAQLKRNLKVIDDFVYQLIHHKRE